MARYQFTTTLLSRDPSTTCYSPLPNQSWHRSTTYLSIYLSVTYLPIYLSIYLSTYLFIYLSIYLFNSCLGIKVTVKDGKNREYHHASVVSLQGKQHPLSLPSYPLLLTHEHALTEYIHLNQYSCTELQSEQLLTHMHFNLTNQLSIYNLQPSHFRYTHRYNQQQQRSKDNKSLSYSLQWFFSVFRRNSSHVSFT